MEKLLTILIVAAGVALSGCTTFEPLATDDGTNVRPSEMQLGGSLENKYREELRHDRQLERSGVRGN